MGRTRVHGPGCKLAAQARREDEPEHDTVKRWQALFGYTYAVAAKEIEDKKRDLSLGSTHTYLVKLEGALSSPESLRAALRREMTPTALAGSDDSGAPAAFCKVSATERDRLLLALSSSGDSTLPYLIGGG
ncbi:hypothetical protein B0T26DRAFT_682094 [Lasiosphaeria miniovina]|uniref:Uncharacterized protein n=1 Tax=Lasiosphaeria miniovina TaxID=1954250 RepID=A0AA39ZQV4_9PEZI|nr:uncharacterized protein B0T26DRAFT_682094 [Lasiosphaeria miniovina]KAK0702014.1 hypothetical protein B0T26DRAFT_682094 [Lasiosphaeria miniovina]